MAKKTSKKKVVTSIKKAPTPVKNPLKPTAAKSKVKATRQEPTEPMLFGKQNYMLLGGGALLMAIGFLLMLGGGMSDPNVWDENIIYGFRRIVLAPFMILAGLVTLIFAIFKRETVISGESKVKTRTINKNL